MKKNRLKYTLFTAAFILMVACSTKRNTFVSRNYNALTTKDNILYNGGIALDKGIVELKAQYVDNFWELLPVERMQVQDAATSNQTKNQNFEKAETKATMAVQKHSMYIEGSEKNPQMDEAHLLLGKARYYNQRFVPALEAFNYVLYKYPRSNKLSEVKIWREKTNMRLENDALAVSNLNKLLTEIKVKDQIFADANATLAQAYLNLDENEKAVAKLKIATEFTKSNEEKSRYRFILGQLYEKMGHKDSAFMKYQEVIDMKRKSARQYVIHAHMRQAMQFDFKKGDTVVFVKKFKDLLKDRENRPFLDVLNHQMGLFYDQMKKPDEAIKYYNKSIRKKSQDTYMIASNYRNLAAIYFDKAKYVTAGKYFDSTLVNLKPRTREYKLITKKRQNLDDVIKYEGIAQRNDSILKLVAFSPAARETYFKMYIDKLKLDEKKQQELVAKTTSDANIDTKPKDDASNQDFIASSDASTFYFYNASTVALGKIEFKEKWGDRPHVENWRISKEAVKENSNADDANDTTKDDSGDTDKKDPKYTTDFYLKKIPSDAKVLDSIHTERNFAYYQLGVIYKEKFKEYPRAADKLEKLLDNKPQERLVLPSMYNLYKIYEITDKNKAAAMKSKILAQYPDSRYAQIISNPNTNQNTSSEPEVAYHMLYKEYENQNYRDMLPKVEAAITQYIGDEYQPKFELLKAQLVGKFKGLDEYKKALNYVALTYPNTEEGKSTEKFIAVRIPYLESLSFNSEFPLSWNILYKADDLNAKKTKELLAKVTQFAKERTIDKLKVSTDIYTIDKNFIVIHGIKELDNAIGIAQVLKEYKDYKIDEPAIIISNENYKVVQVKKNIDEYISGEWIKKPIVPVMRNIVIPNEDLNDNLKEETKETPKNDSNNENAKEVEMQQNFAKDKMNTEDSSSKRMMPSDSDLPKKP
ncbi:type IX secretion system periplasmic lipoprotein PorW/SprE [Flavobacterium aciduliphilum]|uniref:Protein involved in gliding motility SprE n=1 Tax=Flavobacterium aciduliphilum TaxID=1101402 RepID=A0A328YMM2_9FLAO|nr:gliding motility protein [Flavobacterium aciduliphilum]RAR71336.1 protein involved in gliding motility SprE [Flavobacterium aciduliphilum]